MEKLYEVETNRTCISARQFWSHCNRLLKKKGLSAGIEAWLDDFEVWANPDKRHTACDVKTESEICRIQPFDVHLYCHGNFNFILEWFDGHGYMYAMEFDR